MINYQNTQNPSVWSDFFVISVEEKGTSIGKRKQLGEEQLTVVQNSTAENIFWSSGKPHDGPFGKRIGSSAEILRYPRGKK